MQSSSTKLAKIDYRTRLEIVQRFLKMWRIESSALTLLLSLIKLFSHRMNLDLSQMEEGERKDEASPALVFFGNRSHTFSLRCKPKVHAELQTQKCSPEKFLIDNYNSGTGTYLLQLLASH